MAQRSKPLAVAVLALLGPVVATTAAAGAESASMPPAASTSGAAMPRGVAPARAGEVGASPDFNGDGYADVVMPTTDEVVDGVARAGAVFVIPGSRWGPRVMRTQRWTQNSPGILGVAEDGDWFGYGWAAGDFDDDGYDDLAVGAGGEDLGAVPDAGAVHVIYGSAEGLAAAGNRIITKASGPVPGDPADSDKLGQGDMAAGDFDGDGYDDLAAPIVGEQVGAIDNAGGVLVLRGSRWGLTTTGSQVFTQNTSGIVGAAEADDRWSYGGLAAGDWNGDGRADLFVSDSWEDIGATFDAGGFHVLYGTASGLRGLGGDFFSAASPGVPGDVTVGALFGYGHPAAADFDGDGTDDLALPWGYNQVTVGGIPRARAGTVLIVHGSAGGLSALGATEWSQQTPLVPGVPTTDGYWGFFSVAAGNFDRDHRVDLAVADWDETVGGQARAGALYVLQTDGAENIRRATRITEDTPGMQGSAANNYFTDGLLVAGDFNGDGIDDLAAGVSGYNSPAANNAGGVYLFTGARWTALTTNGVRFLTQDTAGIPSLAEQNEWWGFCCY